jgi:Ca2+-binding EF-hand superfamily protein
MWSCRFSTSAFFLAAVVATSVAARPAGRIATPNVFGVADTLFNRIAGPDAKISAEEFAAYIKELSVGGRAAGAAALAQRTFTRLDANNDGSLDEKEFAAFGGRRVGRGAAAGAAAGDSAAGRAARAARAGRAGRAGATGTAGDSASARATADSVFKRVAGSDGSMGREEFDAYLKSTPMGGRVGGQPAQVDKLWTRFDTNTDGSLSRDEFSAVMALLGARGRGRGGESTDMLLSAAR